MSTGAGWTTTANDREVMDQVRPCAARTCDGCKSVLQAGHVWTMGKGAFLFCDKCRRAFGERNWRPAELDPEEEEAAPGGEAQGGAADAAGAAGEEAPEQEEAQDEAPRERTKGLRELMAAQIGVIQRKREKPRPKPKPDQGDGTFYAKFVPREAALAKRPMEKKGRGKNGKDEGREVRAGVCGEIRSEAEGAALGKMLQAAIDRLEGRDHVTEFKGPLAAIDPLKALDGAGEVGAGERGDETTVESKETGPMGKNKKEWTEEQRARHSALMKEVGARRVARKKAAVEGREPAPEKCQAAAPVVMSNGFATPAGTQEPASVSLQEGLTVVRLLRRMSAFERATILELVEGR